MLIWCPTGDSLLHRCICLFESIENYLIECFVVVTTIPYHRQIMQIFVICQLVLYHAALSNVNLYTDLCHLVHIYMHSSHNQKPCFMHMKSFNLGTVENTVSWNFVFILLCWFRVMYIIIATYLSEASSHTINNHVI